MKVILAILTSGLVLASTSAFATELNCTAKYLKNDQQNFSTFSMRIHAEHVVIGDLMVSDTFKADLEREIVNLEAKVAAGNAPKSTAEYLVIRKALLAATQKGLVLKGGRHVYVREPKTPRRRYDLAFESKDVSPEEFAPEANSVQLLINVDAKGRPDLTQATLWYNGTQGPYYDHFSCK